MVPSDNAAYYRRREQTELDMADRAVDPGIAQIHRLMATRYAELAVETENALPML